MTTVEKRSIRNGIVATVVGGLILSAILFFVPTFAQWVSSLISSTWQHSTSSVAVPRCVIWLLFLLSLVILIPSIRPLFKRRRADAVNLDAYTQDEFFGILWRWNFDSRYLSDSIRPYCPRCDTMLVYSLHVQADLRCETSFHCDTCRRDIATLEGDYDYSIATVRGQIDRRIRSPNGSK